MQKRVALRLLENRKFGEFRYRRTVAKEVAIVAVLVAATIFGVFLALWGERAEAQGGYATYYDLSGNVSSSGEVLTADSWTAAHPWWPFGSEVTVCYAGSCVHNVRINDRGPAPWTGNAIDLHIAPAEDLGLAPVVGRDYVRFHREIPGHWDGVYYSEAGSGKWVEQY